MKLIGKNEPLLHLPAAKVTEYDADLAGVIASLFLTLDATPDAAALAAPQVGIPIRAFVYSFDGLRGHMVNPTITTHSEKQRAVTEGCLSYPGQLWRVRRWISCQTASFDRYGHIKVQDWAYFPAQVVQHEIDHLDGIILPDIALRRVAAR